MKLFAFGLLSMVAAGGAAYLLYEDYNWPLYSAWLIGSSLVAFALIGLDKLRSKKGGIPKPVLNSIVLAGGFVGAWLGMFAFWHQLKRFSLWALLIVATLLHGAILYYQPF